jgi:hypothetical protein
MTNLFKIAEDNWPEDEAYGLVASFEGDDWTPDEIDEYARKDIAHMIKVFTHEDDAADLITRFLDKVGETYPEIVKDFR